MEILKLEKKIRHEYNKYTEREHIECVYAYLFLQQTYRDIDENVLKLDKNKTSGRQSNAILGTLGLNDNHKKYFANKLNGATIEEGIEILKNENDKEYKQIIDLLDKLNKSRINLIDDRNITKSKNDIIENKCWKFTKHTFDFKKLCYITKKRLDVGEEDFKNNLNKHIEDINNEYPNLSITMGSGPRGLVMAKIYGLIKNDGKYTPSPVFEEILNRIGSDFENEDEYKDIIEQQIEKIYFLGDILQKKGKEEYSLYIILFLYKVLIEIGIRTGDYKINDKEFCLWVSTSRKYEEWEDTVNLIINSRNQKEIFKKEEDEVFRYLKCSNNTDNRVGSILKNLDVFDKDELSKGIYMIKGDSIKTIETKVKIFEFINSTLKEKNDGAIPNGNNQVEDYNDFLISNIPIIPKI